MYGFCLKSREVSCFMPDCMLNINGYCQRKSYDITPNSIECKGLTLLKNSRVESEEVNHAGLETNS